MMTDRQPKPEYMEKARYILHVTDFVHPQAMPPVDVRIALALEDEAARAMPALSPAVEELVRAAEMAVLLLKGAFNRDADVLIAREVRPNLEHALAAFRSQSEGETK